MTNIMEAPRISITRRLVNIILDSSPDQLRTALNVASVNMTVRQLRNTIHGNQSITENEVESIIDAYNSIYSRTSSDLFNSPSRQFDIQLRELENNLRRNIVSIGVSITKREAERKKLERQLKQQAKRKAMIKKRKRQITKFLTSRERPVLGGFAEVGRVKVGNKMMTSREFIAQNAQDLTADEKVELMIDALVKELIMAGASFNQIKRQIAAAEPLFRERFDNE